MQKEPEGGDAAAAGRGEYMPNSGPNSPSPFAAVTAAAVAAAAAEEDEPPAAAPASMMQQQQQRSASLARDLSELPAAAEDAAAAAAAVLPPRPSSVVGRADSLSSSSLLVPAARSDSLTAQLAQRARGLGDSRPNLAVFGWGRNDCGQLGFPPQLGSETCPHCSSSSSSSIAAAAAAAGPPGILARPTRITALDQQAANTIVGAAASLFNTAVLTADGELFMMGSNESRLLTRRQRQQQQQQQQCGLGQGSNMAPAAAADGDDDGDVDGVDEEDISCQPLRVGALEMYPLGGVALGGQHALAVTQQGLLASWGANDSGQLGTGSSSDKPQHTPKLHRAAAAARGGDRGGSSTGSSSMRNYFMRCAAGAAFSVAVNSSGHCFTFGQGDHGVLGLGPSAPPVSPIPQELPGLWEVAITQVAAGEAHVVALSSSAAGAAGGCVWTWGRGRHGSLGHGDFEDQQTPRQIKSVSGISSVAAGDQHTLLLAAAAPPAGDTSSSSSTASTATPPSTTTSVVYACGRGTFGATGLGITDAVCRPSPIQALTGQTVVQIAAGRQHSLALTAQGDIWTWGAGELGQLGLGCSSCSSSSNKQQQHHEQQQQQEDVHKQNGSETAAAVVAVSSQPEVISCWCLPKAQLSPRRLEGLPWPREDCPVLFICAGGDHNLVLVDIGSSRATTSPCAAAAAGAGRCSLDVIAEDAAAAAAAAGADAAAARQAAAAAAETEGAVAAASMEQQQLPAAAAATPAVQCGPQPGRPTGAMFLPLPPPPLLSLAKAAAAEAAEERRAAGVTSPDPDYKAAAAAAAATAAADGGGAAAAAATARHAAAAAHDAHITRMASSNGSSSSSNVSGSGSSAAAAPPSPLVVDLTHAVLDTFSSPGLLLQLFQASADTSTQQQQQQERCKHTGCQLLPHGLNLDCIDSTYSLLLRSYRREVVSALGAAVLRLVGELPASEGWASGCSPDVVRLIFILMQCPLNSDTYGLGANLLGGLTVLVLKLNRGSLTLLMGWLGELRPEVMAARVVRPVQALITRLCKEAAAAAADQADQQRQGPNAPHRRPPPGLGAARGDILLLARLLDVLYTANVQAGELIPYSEFASSPLCSTANLLEEYHLWLQTGTYRLQFQAFQEAAHRATSAAAAATITDLQLVTTSTSSSTNSSTPQQSPDKGTNPSAASGGVAAGGGDGSSSSDHAAAAGASSSLLLPGVVPGRSISSLCEVPFLLTTQAKSNILKGEASLQQRHVVHESAIAALMQGLPPGGVGGSSSGSGGRQQQQQQQQRADAASNSSSSGSGSGSGSGSSRLQQQQQQPVRGGHGRSDEPHVVTLDPLSLTLSLRVRRGHVLMDALAQIRGCGPQELKKPLRVTFLSEDGRVAEEGVDQGGVSREFFQLLVVELFSPDYGMFVEVEESSSMWFNTASLESLDEFELVGIILGLACYNNVIVDAHLPLPAYKKLMGLTPAFADLELLYPSLHKGLKQLMEFEGDDVENTFCRSFEVEYEAYGESVKVELVPGGASIPVTAHNRAAFVAAYTSWLLGGSIRDQFAAFASGFHRVCGGPALSLFRYEEVELLVEGLPHLDFNQLQAGARYEGGFNESHPTVVNLWSVLLSLPIDEKRAFLQFATGCDRAPVAGLKALQLMVQRAGPDSDKLPTAHTCFNALLLPDYSSRAKLRSKLMTAIQNAQGFGLQ